MQRRAPLALRESLSRVDNINEIKDFRIYEKPRDLKLPGVGINNQEFYDLSRKQQNLKELLVMRRGLKKVLESNLESNLDS